jgi:hypothetical protein
MVKTHGKDPMRGLRLCSGFKPPSSGSQEIGDEETGINKRGLEDAMQMKISRFNPHISGSEEIGDQ